MELVLDVPDALAATLGNEAERRGQLLSEYAVELLSAAPEGPEIRTGAELVAYWRREGLFRPLPDSVDSVELAPQDPPQGGTPGAPITVMILDTDVLIDLQRRFPPAVEWLAGQTGLPVASGLAVMEMLDKARNRRESDASHSFVKPFPVLWPATEDCERALRDFAALHLSHGLGLIDALVAATAVGLDAELCTFNVKHYRAVPNLRLRQPYAKGEARSSP